MTQVISKIVSLFFLTSSILIQETLAATNNQNDNNVAAPLLFSKFTNILDNEQDQLVRVALQKIGPDLRQLRDFSDSYSDDEQFLSDLALRGWQAMRKQASFAIKNKLSALEPGLNETLLEAKVSASCLSASKLTLNAASNLESWAIQMLSAWGSFPPTGLFEGTFGDVGSYRGCLAVPESKAIGHSHYCSLSFRPLMGKRANYELIVRPEPEALKDIFAHHYTSKSNNSSPLNDTVDVFTDIMNFSQYFHYVYLKLGTCLPIACSPRDVQQVSHVLASRWFLQSGPVKCYSKYHDDYQGLEVSTTQDLNGSNIFVWKPQVTKTQFYALIALGLVSFIVFGATLADLILFKIPNLYKKLCVMCHNDDNDTRTSNIGSYFAQVDEYKKNKKQQVAANVDYTYIHDNGDNNCNQEQQINSQDAVDRLNQIELSLLGSNGQARDIDNGKIGFGKVPNRRDAASESESLVRQLIRDLSVIENVVEFFEIGSKKSKKNKSGKRGNSISESNRKGSSSKESSLTSEASSSANIEAKDISEKSGEKEDHHDQLHQNNHNHNQKEQQLKPQQPQQQQQHQHGEQRDISCIHGLRCVTMTWIIINHSMQYNDWSAFARTREVETHLKSLVTQPLFNGSYLVDTFFLISGLLTSYTTLNVASNGNKQNSQVLKSQSSSSNLQCCSGVNLSNKSEHKLVNDLSSSQQPPQPQPSSSSSSFKWRNFLIGRYLRLTPQVLLVSLLFIVLPLINPLGSPHWYTMTGEYSEYCAKNWWLNLFHVQAFIRPGEMCNFASWWISVDSFFHLIATVCLIIILKFGSKFASKLCLSLTILAMLIQFGQHFKLALPPNIFSTIPQTEAMFTKATLSFFWTPIAHSVPFLLGLYAGFLFVKRPNLLQSKLNWSRAIPIWLLVLTCSIVQSYSTYFWVIGALNYTRTISTIFNVLSTLFWSLYVLWVIIACRYNYGGPINKLLSCRLFLVLSRASYLIYLSHFLVLFSFFGSQNLLIEPSQLMMTYIMLGNICLSTLFGSFLCVAFEMPWLKLHRRIMRRLNSMSTRSTKKNYINININNGITSNHSNNNYNDNDNNNNNNMRVAPA